MAKMYRVHRDENGIMRGKMTRENVFHIVGTGGATPVNGDRINVTENCKVTYNGHVVWFWKGDYFKKES